MRYYSFEISDPASGASIKKWQSHPGGVFDPQAQNIMFDVPIAGYGAPIGAQAITIEGISLSDLQSASQYGGMQFELKSGMAQGLPLANPAQQGTIASGLVFQSYGHWEGTEMTLDFVCKPSSFTLYNPGNIVITWAQGTVLSDALTMTLQNAFPGIPLTVNISPSLVLTNDEVGFYPTLEGLGQYIYQVTDALGSPVTIAYQNGEIVVSDGSVPTNPIQINFTDMVGQPTWLEVNVMQVKLIMRGDITIGSTVLMPAGMVSAPGFVATLQASLPSSLHYQSTFQGNFTVMEMRHIGNFRSPDGTSWVTVLNCVPNE